MSAKVILTAEQEDACTDILGAINARKDAALLGPAGSGKTEVVAWLLRQQDDARAAEVAIEDETAGEGRGGEHLLDVAVAAPTHRAAGVLRKRLRKAGMSNPVNTLHSLLYRPKWLQPFTNEIGKWIRGAVGKKAVPPPPPALLKIVPEARVGDMLVGVNMGLSNEDIAIEGLKAARIEPLNCILDCWVLRTGKVARVVIMDEASMLTREQAMDLRGLCDTLVLVGDPMQLPPVEKDRRDEDADDVGVLDQRFLKDFRVTELTENHRAKGDGPGAQIAGFCARLRAYVRNPETDDLTLDDLKDVLREEAKKPGSIIQFAKEWPLQAILGGAPAIVWRNGIRMSVNARAREAAGLSLRALSPDERIIITAVPSPDPTGRLVVNSTWQVHRDLGDGNFELIDRDDDPPARVQTTLNVRENITDTYLANMRAYDPPAIDMQPEIGRGRVYAAPAWAMTAHRMQGGEAEHVCIAWYDLEVLAGKSSGKARNTEGVPQWLRWFYTAFTRARSRVTLVLHHDFDKPGVQAQPARADRWPGKF